MDLGAWEAVGLYDPDGPDADERRVVLELLAASGLSPQAVAAATGVQVTGGGETRLVPAEEAARRVGSSVDRLRRARLATGLPWPEDGQLAESWVEAAAAFELGTAIFGEPAILAFSRVLGSAARRVADAAMAMFATEVPDEERRARVGEAARAAAETVPVVFGRVFAELFDRQPTVLEAGVGTVGVGFVDLVGSTAWAEARSLRDQSAALTRFEALAWDAARDAGGHLVKLIGDEAMVVGGDAAIVATAATAVCRGVGSDPDLPPARAAVGYGPAMVRAGDYFGPLVNQVARAVKAAPPGQVVAVGEAASALAGVGWVLRPLGHRQLRGMAAPVGLHLVEAGGPAPDALSPAPPASSGG